MVTIAAVELFWGGPVACQLNTFEVQKCASSRHKVTIACRSGDSATFTFLLRKTCRAIHMQIMIGSSKRASDSWAYVTVYYDMASRDPADHQSLTRQEISRACTGISCWHLYVSD